MKRTGARTALPNSRQRPMRRVLAAIAAFALGAGLAVVGAAAPASAHTGDLLASAVCNTTTGQYDVTYTLKLTNVGSTLTGTTKWRVGTTSFQGTPTNANGMDRGPITSKGNTTLTLGTESLPGTTKGGGPWVYAYTSWTDGYGKGSDGRIEGLKGDCKAPEPTSIPVPVKPSIVDLCGTSGDHVVEPRATEGVSWSISPVVGGKAKATATAKPGYVFSDGSAVKSWDFEFTDVPCIVEIPVPPKPDATEACGVDGDAVILPDDSDTVTWKLEGDPKTGAATAVATAKKGYEFPGGKTEQRYDYTFTNEPCPVIVPEPVEPEIVDLCDVDRDEVLLPEETEQLVWHIEGEPSSGSVTAVAVTKGHHVFEDGTTERRFELSFTNEPCPIELPVPAKPAAVDLCGVDDDRIVLPADTDTVSWAIEGDATTGSAVAVATAAEGHVFESGETTERFVFEFDQTECVPPTLAGSSAAALCVANVPWIDFDVVLTDPDQQSTGHTAYLVLSDGTHTERVELGPLGEDGSVDGRVLWPGAAIDEAGNPTAWPGWKQLPNGRWVVTEENFGWTHALTSASIEVNPELSIDLEYPPAVVACAPSSKSTGTPGTPVPSGDGDGQGLASTGFTGGPAIGLAGGLVLAGALALAVQLILRRKRA